MTTAKKTEVSAAELEIKRRGRRRLIGAGTLGLLAVVILPMVFDSDPKRQNTGKQEIAIQIPPKEGQPPLVAPMVPPPLSPAVTVPATPAPPAIALSQPGPKPAPQIAASAKSALVEPKVEAGTEAKVESNPAAKSDGKPKAEPKAESSAKSGFVVQVGAYKDADNAKSIVAQLKEAKLPVFTDTIAVKAGKVIRVRVGPFPTKVKAASALAQVKLAGADGKIVPLQ